MNDQALLQFKCITKTPYMGKHIGKMFEPKQQPPCKRVAVDHVDTA